MSIVKRLPDSISQKIAAGEVVTRSESVVKELVENSLDDRERLTTYGFRGEALAAIASVSKFEMLTRPSRDELGTSVQVEGSILRSCESTACDEGTSISVRNIFFNIPARRKFMK